MSRRAAIALLAMIAGGAAKAAPAAGPTPSAPVLSSDAVDSDLQTGETTFRGSARYSEGPLLITADEIRSNARTNVLLAQGHAMMTRGDERLVADRLTYNRAAGTFTAENIRIGRYPFYIQGRSADGSRTEIVIHHASISYSDPGKWKPSIKAETIVYAPGHYLRMVRSLVGLHGEEIVPLGALRQDLTSVLSFPYVSVSVGYRSSLGATADLGLRLPVAPGLKLGGDLGIFTARGVMIGPSADYFNPSNPAELIGYFRSGWIEDYGNRFADVLGNPIPKSREYAEWRQQQQLSPHLTLAGEVNWWSDSDVIRDFNPKRFYQDQNPDSYVEADYTGDNYFATAFARFHPNSWEAVQERLPEFSYNLLPSALGGGFYQRLEASADYLREVSPEGVEGIRAIGFGNEVLFRPVGPIGGPELAEGRIDTFYEVSHPWAPNDWFTLVPVAGVRLTDYTSTEGAAQPGGYFRALGELGFDAQLRSSGTFNYQNPIWEIDGLRHLLTPIVSYRYIPDADKGQAYIPQIDTQTFSTYLQPLDLGDVRYLDQLQSQNTFRLGLNNTLQTRMDGYGSRDLLTFDVADDFHFRRTSQETDFSDLHTDLAITPAKWLEYDVTEINSPETFELREFTSGLIVHDGDQWYFRIGNDFVRHEDDNYILDTMVKLNEQYQATFLAIYDARVHILDRVALGLVENLANTWKLDYLLVFNGGPNREGKVGFQVQVDVLRF